MEARISSTDRMLGVLAHASAFFMPLLVPIVLLLVGHDNRFVYHHAKRALLFHLIAWLAIGVSSFLIVILVGLLLLPVAVIGSVVLTIIAIVKTLEDEYYRYPFCGHWIS
jgi:uncharacterized membrane protein